MELHLLLVTADPQTLTLAEFLSRQNCRVEQCSDLEQLPTILTHYQQRGEPHHCIFFDADLAGEHAIGYVEYLRKNHPDMALAFLVEFMKSAELRPKAEYLGCAIVLEKPVDLSNLERFIQNQRHFRESGLDVDRSTGGRLHSRRHSRRSVGETTGISRSTSLTPKTGNTPQNGTTYFGTTRTQHQERSDSYQRTSSNSNIHSTIRRRRSIHGAVDEDISSGTRPSVPGLQAAGAITSNEAAAMMQQAQTQKKVMCAHCQQTFQVIAKPEAYTMPCIHCGGLNRIMP